jgi:hypothetical protein
MQARDFAALQARQQGMFPGLAFYLVRLTSNWSKTYHEYVDCVVGATTEFMCMMAEVARRLHHVISQRTTQVLSVRWIRVMSLLLQQHVPYALCLPISISGTQLGQHSITLLDFISTKEPRLYGQRLPLQCRAQLKNRASDVKQLPTAPLAHAYINTLGIALFKALLHAATTYTEHNSGLFPMCHQETVEGIVSQAQSSPQVASARGRYLQDVPQIYPHLATDPKIADFIAHSLLGLVSLSHSRRS